MFVNQQQGPDVFPYFLDGLLLVFLNVLVIISSASELKTKNKNSVNITVIKTRN